jgi:carbon-monoxide dehydrogenase large subunit
MDCCGAEEQSAADCAFLISPYIDALPPLPDDLKLDAEARHRPHSGLSDRRRGVEAEVDPRPARSMRRYTWTTTASAINPLICTARCTAARAGCAIPPLCHEPGSGQLLSASFLDYGMPRADHFPHLDVELTEDPTKGNALRVKGGGEAGITPSSAVLINAVIDALSGLGIEHIDMPATPQRVWAAIRAARDGAKRTASR